MSILLTDKLAFNSDHDQVFGNQCSGFGQAHNVVGLNMLIRH
jgi:hypothetical protein